MSKAPTFALAAPVLVWLTMSGAVFVKSVAGYPPMAAPPAMTLSEAAAIRQTAEVLRLARRGDDLDASYHVRRTFIRDKAYRLTPIEAAISSRRLDVVEYLVDLGATIDSNNAAPLYCLAKRGGADDIAEYITTRVRPFDVNCAMLSLPF